MKQILIFPVLILFIQAYGQIENRWQPDSIYQKRKVKKIYAYLNSKKDLSEIIEFNRDGRKIRSVKYSASYDKKTRRNKRIEMRSYLKYDLQMKLTEIIDSIVYWDNSYNTNNTNFYYNSNGTLTNVKHYKAKFETPISETYYQNDPYQSTTIQRNDSIIIYHKTKEYDKDFYVNKFYGYYVEPKLKSGIAVLNGDTSLYQYSDYSDMQRFEDSELIMNTFNPKGQLMTSSINSIFMNNRRLAYKLSYNYFSNGLLKSIRGYVPEFFKYEFYQ